MVFWGLVGYFVPESLHCSTQEIYLQTSICLSLYLLNHLAEFCQTCYITSSNGKGVQEQHYFPLCPSVPRPSICLSHCLLLNHWAEFNQTYYITSLHSKVVREQHFVSLHPSIPASFFHPSVHHAISS